VRAWDIREPQGPVEVAFHVSETTHADAGGCMTKRVEVDERGYV